MNHPVKRIQDLEKKMNHPVKRLVLDYKSETIAPWPKEDP